MSVSVSEMSMLLFKIICFAGVVSGLFFAADAQYTNAAIAGVGTLISYDFLTIYSK